MSTIEKMQIQGIRSYGPKDQDTQIIEFFTPVTLIVGQNGSGKTTIIECLKYATTSDMPPNTKGVSFIFDPKLIDEVETKARLKLHFRDTSGLGVQVHKNMSVTQKAKKLEFRTLETIITRYDEYGKTKSTITSKCINADAEVINALGVSKAVLEHVIFCHQEDSNWPLSDAKTLKTRFDEIFAATKYIKALETMRKVRLEKQALIRQMEVDRKHLEGYKNRSTQLERDMNDCMAKLDTFKSRREEIQEKIAPVDKQLEYFMQEAAKIVELKQELDKIESEKALIEKQIKELLIATKDCLFAGTDAELREYVQEYNAKTDKMRKEEDEATSIKIRQLGEKLKQLSAQKNKISLELGSMENKSTVCANQKLQLAELKKRATNLTEREDVNDEATLAAYISAYEDETRAIEDKSRSALTQIESRIEQARDHKSKIDQNILNKTDLVKKNKSQLEKIDEELALIENDKVQVELTKKIKDCENEIAKEQNDEDDVEKLKEEIDEAEREQSKLKTKQNQLDEKIAKWHVNSKAKTEIDMMRAEKRSKLDQIRRKKKSIEEEMEKFFDMSKNENIRDEISEDERLKAVYDQECRELSSEMSSNEERRKEIEKRLCSAELRRKMLSDEMKTKEKRSRACEEELVSAMGVEDESELEHYESTLEKLENEYKTHLDEKGFLNGVDKTYKRFLQQLQQQHKPQSDHSCPVCMRCFKDERELTDTVAELKKYTSKLPQKMTDLESKLNNTQTKLDRMRESKSTKEEYDRLRNKDLPELKSQVEQLDKETLNKLKKDLREIEETRNRLQERKSYAEQIQTDVILIDKLATECSEIERRVETATKALPVDDAGTDLASLNDEKKQINSDINRVAETISSKRERTNQCYKRRDRVNALKERLNELKTRRNELEMRAQKKTSLSEKRVELREEIEEAEAECAKLSERLKASVKALAELQKERESAVGEQRAVVDKRRRVCEEMKQLSTRLVEISRAIETFERDELPRLEKLRKEVKAIDQDEKQVQSDLEKCRRQQDEIRNELARQELKKRELNDNLRLREKRSEHEAKKKQHAEKLDQVNARGVNVDLRTFNQEQKKLESQRDQLRRELNDVRTNELTLEGRLHAIRDEMALENHKNALQKYLVCLADLKVLEISVMDIEKYYKALDRAIMNYHLMKMSAINKIIKQLWRQVYRGTDIDHVEIRSEEEDTAGADGVEKEVSLKARRTYTYRVVMVKGDTVLDMRGRCSAGQKVLASIIIRLALAETFCLNSGILALDEPTTNLDRENIESLASALVEIIKSRSAQRNFQLIIITHDEDFVEMLGRSEFMDQYYRVHKDDNGFSRITRRSNEHF